MLDVEQYEYIRTAHRIYNKSISEIARDTGHSRNTVKKVLRGEYTGYTKRKTQPCPVLGPYHDVIYKWLEEDLERPKKQRHTAKRIYDRLLNEYDFNGGETTVRKYVSIIKRSLGLKNSEAFVPIEPVPRGETEADWGSATVILKGEEVRVKMFCMRSKYSGMPFVRLYPCERQQALFDGLSRGFEYYGGVFPVMIFDNLTSAVKKIFLGKERKEQESFVRFRSWYTFEVRFCTPGRGNEKGGVEGLVGYARRNFLVPLPRGESLEEINDKLLAECIGSGSRKIGGREGTIMQLYEAEKRLSSLFLNIPSVTTEPYPSKWTSTPLSGWTKTATPYPALTPGACSEQSLRWRKWMSIAVKDAWQHTAGSTVATTGC